MGRECAFPINRELALFAKNLWSESGQNSDEEYTPFISQLSLHFFDCSPSRVSFTVPL
jgi:hypothetical protein